MAGCFVWELVALLLDRRASASRLALLARATERALPLALTLSFLCVPAASARIFQTFLCDRFIFDDFEGTSKQYLHQDYALDCASDEYLVARNAALVLLALWPVGVPLLYVALLLCCRGALKTHNPTRLSRACRFLWLDYTTDAYLWEPLELTRKSCLTGWPALSLTLALSPTLADEQLYAASLS